MKATILWTCIVLFGRVGCMEDIVGDNCCFSEKDLHKHLFETYNPNIIPNLKKYSSIMVDMEMFLVAIEDIDEKKQTLTARVFLEVRWIDEYLTWDNETYGGVATINVPSDSIWFPDITLSGTLDKPYDIGQAGGRAVVDMDGKVVVWPYKTHTIACSINVANFPLDTQICKFDFSSWTNPTTVISLVNPSKSVQLSYFKESGEWAVVDTSTEIYHKAYGSDKYSHLVFKLHLKRKWLFHAMNNMAPVVCISLLNVFCFLLPAQSGERVTLCISIFLTLAVFLTVINNALPESSDEVAIFGIYVGLQLLGSALTIITTVLSIYFYHRKDTDEVSRLMQCLANVCCPISNRHHNNHAKVVQSEGTDCGNNLLQVNSGTQRNSLDASVVHYRRVTWVMVSDAVDRLCFVCAICWHVFLAAFLIIGLNVME